MPQRTAWFFLVLPEPVGLPDKYQFTGYAEPSFYDRRSADKVGEHDPPPRLVASFLVRQVPGTGLHDDVRMLVDQAREAFPVLGSRDSQARSPVPSPVESITTVVEVAVTLPSEDVSDADIDDAFERALEATRQLQRRYSVIAQHPLNLATREKLPAAVPFVLGRTYEDQRPQADLDGLSLLSLTPASVARRTSPGLLTDEESAAFEIAMSVDERGSPFVGYADLRREARAQYWLEGNHSLAITVAATAAEVLLDVALLHAMWQEEVQPQNAANLFEGTGLAARIRAEYHGRFGGGWAAPTGPVARFQSDLASLRHRVIHGGYRPTATEASRAIRALGDLEAFVGDQVSSVRALRNYPRTALALCGERGLRRRNRWSRRLEGLVFDESEPDWEATFARWRWVVDDIRLGSPVVPGQNAEALAAVLLVPVSGPPSWYLHDGSTHRVVAAGEPVDMTAEAKASHAILVESLHVEGAVPVSIAWMGDPPEPAPRAVWQRDHEVLPEHHLLISDAPGRA